MEILTDELCNKDQIDQSIALSLDQAELYYFVGLLYFPLSLNLKT